MISSFTRHTPLLCALLALSHLLAPSAAQTCYNQNDSIDPSAVPCYPSNTTGTSQSFCCAVGRQCYTNGLCGPSDTDPNYGRLSCTDPTWRSPNCPQFCLSNDQAGGAVVVLCPGTDNQYCCSNLARDGTTFGCCDDQSNLLALGKLVEVDNGTVVSSTTTTSTSASTSAPTSTPTTVYSSTSVSASAAPAVTSLAASSNSSHSSSTAIGVGVGVGVAVVLAIGAILFFLMRRRRARQARTRVQDQSIMQPVTPHMAEAPPGRAPDVKYELVDSKVPIVRSFGSTAELDGRSEWRGGPAELS